MANPFVKAWKYLMALFSSKVDEYADPKVQIQQAIEEAQRTHQALTQQAAQVIGNQRQLEMRLNRQLADIEKLQVNVRQALTLADQAVANGDAAKATEYNNAAEAFAAQLVTAEQSVEDLKALHDQALQAAAQAKKAVEQNAMMLQTKIAERTKLLSQLEQAKMQEQVSASLRSMSEIAAPGNTPSLDEVRDKIERRYANAMGEAELAQNSVQGRMMEVQQASVQMAGHSRLEQIRASMRGEALAVRRRRSPGHPCHPGEHSRARKTSRTVGGERRHGGQTRQAGIRLAPVALGAAARYRHRQRVRGRGGAEAVRGLRSPRPAAAQAALGAAAGCLLRLRDGVVGVRHRTSGDVEHPGVGAADHRHHRRGRCGAGHVVPAALPVPARRAAAAAARRSAAAGCRRTGRRRGRRCRRWEPPSVGCIRCSVCCSAETCCRPRRFAI